LVDTTRPPAEEASNNEEPRVTPETLSKSRHVTGSDTAIKRKAAARLPNSTPVVGKTKYVLRLMHSCMDGFLWSYQITHFYRLLHTSIAMGIKEKTIREIIFNYIGCKLDGSINLSR
jgi:hypothetical protein